MLQVPPVSDKLQNALQRVLDNKILNDDAFWCADILPALLDRLHEIKLSVASKDMHPECLEAHIVAVADEIQSRLQTEFSDGAPFTILRIAELVLRYDDNGYSLSTAQHMKKYIDALKKTVFVSSKETDYPLSPGETSRPQTPSTLFSATPSDYDHHNLPTNVLFVPIPWAETSNQMKDKHVEESEKDEVLEEPNNEPDEKIESSDNQHVPTSDSPNGDSNGHGTSTQQRTPDPDSVNEAKTPEAKVRRSPRPSKKQKVT
ncbi:hypothetical protein CLUG_00638 [Clavispora lusitaniae ATCC 42720]|uniref:Uncharacterized protein n=1 Tax=Clavispora lusitaniae (strain ATCC 42720) TaxID=306902 RepID=C4XXG5_CLAL4|nr:uncharacterized protein CLUG_00638 [Clavispora lusitaniae ATCC 42720]EEQ36515.1 hypothetical protein CLUG_00638 [Clavispora lusitaniae ATCC 42720]KAF5213011.1 hypothetical protein E0198_000525 [Clavispora lusitaniae]